MSLEPQMSSEPTANGAERRDPSQRPSWYVPLKPVPEDGRTVQESMREHFIVDPDGIPDDLQEELVAFLDSFREPRES